MMKKKNSKAVRRPSRRSSRGLKGSVGKVLFIALAAVGLLAAVQLVGQNQNLNRSAAEYVRAFAPSGMASRNYSPPGSTLTVYPTSGNWNKTPTFLITNNGTTTVTFTYLLDCWNEKYCKDVKGSQTLAPKQSVTLGLGEVCSKWQLDLNYTGRSGWDWGAVVEQMKFDCNCIPFGDKTTKELIFTEKSGAIGSTKFLLSDAKMKKGTVDYGPTSARESYDIFFSDANGAENAGGSYITVSMKRSTTGSNLSSGNNIDSVVIRDNATGAVYPARAVASAVRGTSLSASFNDQRNNALGLSDGNITYMGDPTSSITLAYDEELSCVPVVPPTPEPPICDYFGDLTKRQITFTERTSGARVATFLMSDPKMAPGTNDLSTGAGEVYDLYRSNATGGADAKGDYIAIRMRRNQTLSNANSGNNVDSLVITDLVDSKQYPAGSVVFAQRGSSLSSSFDDQRNNALGLPDTKATYMGDPTSLLVLGDFGLPNYCK